MAINAEYVTDTGDNTNNEPRPQPFRRKLLLHIRPGAALPLLASLFPYLRHRANTAVPPVTPSPTPPPLTPDPAVTTPVDPPVTPAPIESTPNSNDVLMSVEDFSRFVDAAEDLLKPVPQLWQRFIDLLDSFLPQSPAAAEG